MMAYSELSESEVANGVFAPLDYVERLTRHRAAVLDARGEAGRCRLVPNTQASPARPIANLLLRQSSLQEWSGDVVLLCGLLTGTEVALIVEVHPVRNRVEVPRFAQFLHHDKQLILALKAALSVI